MAPKPRQNKRLIWLIFGAGEGNRNLVFSLEGCCSAIELHPRRRIPASAGRLGSFMTFPARRSQCATALRQGSGKRQSRRLDCAQYLGAAGPAVTSVLEFCRRFRFLIDQHIRRRATTARRVWNWKRRMARIFISHSSRDNDAADRMKSWLESQKFDKTFLDKDKTTGISARRRLGEDALSRA